MKDLNKFLDLDPVDRLLLVKTLLLLPWVGLVLKFQGFKRAQRFLTYLIPHNPLVRNKDIGRRDLEARRIARLVSVAAAHGPYKARCLERSLALWWFLKRRGIESKIRIGARKTGEGLDAHAWVEMNDMPLNESRDVRGNYAVLH